MLCIKVEDSRTSAPIASVICDGRQAESGSAVDGMKKLLHTSFNILTFALNPSTAASF